MASVIDVATTLGYAHWRDDATNAPRRCECGRFTRGPRNAPGWPDLILCRPGRLIFAELKSEKGEVSTEQGAWLRMLELAGAETYVWRPSQMQELGLILQGDIHAPKLSLC